MYDVILYEDSCGDSPVEQLIDELEARSLHDKKARTTLNTIDRFIGHLVRSGTRGSKKITKHLRDGIWQLRPQNYRILFGVYGNKIVLLNYFVKKGQKTPNSEIERAKKLFHDWVNHHREKSGE